MDLHPRCGVGISAGLEVVPCPGAVPAYLSHHHHLPPTWLPAPQTCHLCFYPMVSLIFRNINQTKYVPPAVSSGHTPLARYKLCPTSCDAMDYSLLKLLCPWIFQVRTLEWKSSLTPGVKPCLLQLAGRFLTTESPGKPLHLLSLGPPLSAFLHTLISSCPLPLVAHWLFLDSLSSASPGQDLCCLETDYSFPPRVLQWVYDSLHKTGA